MLKYLLFIAIATQPCLAEPPVLKEEVEENSQWNLVKQRLRVRFFNEYMAPSLSGSSPTVPNDAGTPFVPTFLSSLLWIDYEVLPKYRLVYYQKGIFTFADPKSPSGIGGRPLDPRFAVRRTQVLDFPGLATEYDLFLQPGITAAWSRQVNRSFDIGFRMNHRYVIPKSSWSMGAITEFTWTFYHANGVGGDFGMILYPWASYALSSRFSTQHWVFVPVKHQMGEPGDRFAWDITGAPYIQNGVKMNLNDQVWVGLMLNNYLTSVPTLHNSWLSLWLNISAI